MKERGHWNRQVVWPVAGALFYAPISEKKEVMCCKKIGLLYLILLIMPMKKEGKHGKMTTSYTFRQNALGPHHQPHG